MNNTKTLRLPRLSPWAQWVLPMVAALLVGGAYVGWSAWRQMPHTAGAQLVPVSGEIEARWGIRITQVGVTADGGLVDVRFMVLDVDKTLAMMQDVNNLPVLVAEADGTALQSAAQMAARHNLAVGRTFFLLYRNTNGSVHHGGTVTVRFGDLSLSRVPAL